LTKHPLKKNFLLRKITKKSSHRLSAALGLCCATPNSVCKIALQLVVKKWKKHLKKFCILISTPKFENKRKT
jgi:hypothetical protein